MKCEAVVQHWPEERGHMVTMHACWSADNGIETAVFPTKQEAIDFCWRRWRLRARVIEPKDAAGS